jgi:2-(1,2-epoxy-1,2-dihydrophenyl)acetyl-CoA isomerase
MIYQNILLDIGDNIATLTLNRPERLNAFSVDMLKELLDAVANVEGHRSVRALVLTGVGRAFSSGADLTSDGQMQHGVPDVREGLEKYCNPLIMALSNLSIPFVAAVNGAAAGGGCSLALAADIVIAARSAYFLQAFVRIGLVPDMGGTWILPRLIGKARAQAMMVMGERISAETARDWGMIYQVADDDAVLSTAVDLAQRLAVGPTKAYPLIRQGIAACFAATLPEALAVECANQVAASRTYDFSEGVTAFRQRRKPVFEGR